MTPTPAPALTAAEQQTVSFSDPEFTPISPPLRKPGTPGLPHASILERDLSFDITDDGCYQLTDRLREDGYGVIKLYGSAHLAHRSVWLGLVGHVPADMHLDHLCRNRACINPDHLEVVTPRVNVLRSDSPAARLARQTHCKNGHEWTEATTRSDNKGNRMCGVCKPRLIPSSEKPHGTSGRYKSGCRCDDCRDAENGRQRAATARRRAAKGLDPYMRQANHPHGTRSRYRSGCRCDPCRQSEAAYKRFLMQRSSGAGTE